MDKKPAQNQNQNQNQGGSANKKSNKRNFQALNKYGASQVSDNLLKKIKRETNLTVQGNKLVFLDSINQKPDSKRFDISTNGKIKVTDYAQNIISFMGTEDTKNVYIHGKDKAIGKSITIAEIIKRMASDLKQKNEIFSTLEPSKEKDQPPIEHAHFLIHLFREKKGLEIEDKK